MGSVSGGGHDDDVTDHGEGEKELGMRSGGQISGQGTREVLWAGA